jgi:cell division protease FtsH
MADDSNKDFKKGFSNSFIWILLAAFFIAMLVQGYVETKSANVSFSYQLEHLVNLQLLQPEDSRKTALNDNLATFSGQFRERLTDEGKKRYKYLELLEANQNLNGEKEQIESDLSVAHSKISDAADMFLHLSQIPIPKGGYIVFEDVYHPEAAIVINELSSKNVVGLKDLQKQFETISQDSTEQTLNEYGQAILGIVRNFRSPYLGIGNEAMKQTLRNMEVDLKNVSESSSKGSARLGIFEKSLKDLQEIVNQLNKTVDGIRLSQLRSVRDYKESMEAYSKVSQALSENEAQLDKARSNVMNVIWYFNNKELSTKTLERQDPEVYNQWFQNAKREWNQFLENKGGYFNAPDQPLNKVLERTFKSVEPTPNYLSYLITMMPVLLVVLLLYFVFARQMKGMGSSAMNFGKSPAKLLHKGSNKITFKDVAGVEEALEELVELVDFLKNPQKFTALGGHIPKGVLLIGPPGTGKTLIAKAVAGEADRPFFSISGSDFVEMFVGVGASRIRDMFDQAKKQAPCIIFIDEIDAVGRHRGAGIGGGHDEREQTLNQLLVEMDGFDANEGVIIIAATNRPDVLDKALLRPGRFDRRVIINLPDIKGRYEILKVHSRKIKMDPNVDLMNLARSTPGASGADLENILNEAALLAARKEKSAVTNIEVREARDKVLFGKERRSLEMDENEKITTAYHESGHTIVGLAVEHSDPIDKVTIIPRGFSLGSTMFLPKKNRLSYWRKELVDQLAVLMGGRCAEEIFVSDISSGAQQDIERATQLARSMVCEWGMSDKLGAVAYDQRSDNGQYLGMMNYHEKKYSEETAREIDAEVRRILDEAYLEAKRVIQEKRDQVELMTKMLIEFETLNAEDIQKIYDGTWTVEDKKERLKQEEDLHKKHVQESIEITETDDSKKKGRKIVKPKNFANGFGS